MWWRGQLLERTREIKTEKFIVIQMDTLARN